MSERLKGILRRYVGPAGALGSGDIDRTSLQESLKNLMGQTQRMLWLAVLMATVIFIVEIIIAFLNAGSPGIVAGVAGAMGLTAAGSIEVVRRIAHDIAQINLVIILAGTLDSEALKPIVAALVNKL
jgi:hypothetical protein